MTQGMKQLSISHQHFPCHSYSKQSLSQSWPWCIFGTQTNLSCSSDLCWQGDGFSKERLCTYMGMHARLGQFVKRRIFTQYPSRRHKKYQCEASESMNFLSWVFEIEFLTRSACPKPILHSSTFQTQEYTTKTEMWGSQGPQWQLTGNPEFW